MLRCLLKKKDSEHHYYAIWFVKAVAECSLELYAAGFVCKSYFTPHEEYGLQRRISAQNVLFRALAIELGTNILALASSGPS